MFAANTLLDADLDYIQAEKDSISSGIRDNIQKRVDDRLAVLYPASAPGGLTPGNKIIVLSAPYIKDSSDILKDIYMDFNAIKKKEK